MIYLIIGILLAVMLVYILKRKPVWLEQITPSGKKIYVCAHCGEIWHPTIYSGFQLELMPPSECPNCHKEMRMYH